MQPTAFCGTSRLAHLWSHDPLNYSSSRLLQWNWFTVIVVYYELRYESYAQPLIMLGWLPLVVMRRRLTVSSLLGFILASIVNNCPFKNPEVLWYPYVIRPQE